MDCNSAHVDGKTKGCLIALGLALCVAGVGIWYWLKEVDHTVQRMECDRKLYVISLALQDYNRMHGALPLQAPSSPGSDVVSWRVFLADILWLMEEPDGRQVDEHTKSDLLNQMGARFSCPTATGKRAFYFAVCDASAENGQVPTVVGAVEVSVGTDDWKRVSSNEASGKFPLELFEPAAHPEGIGVCDAHGDIMRVETGRIHNVIRHLAKNHGLPSADEVE